jgi:hypothetical protein
VGALHDHPIKNNPRVLCGLWRCNTRKAKRLLTELVEAGKLKIQGEWITNARAMNDVSMRRELQDHAQITGKSGGIQSGKSRRKPLENKEYGEGNPSTREEKSRVE